MTIYTKPNWWTDSHISHAIKRLAKTGATSYTEVIEGVASTTVNITREAKDSVVDVVTHVAGNWYKISSYLWGNDVGKVTKDTLEIGTDIFDTTVKIKALTAKKLLAKGIKSAAKAGIKTIAERESEKGASSKE